MALPSWASNYSGYGNDLTNWDYNEVGDIRRQKTTNPFYSEAGEGLINLMGPTFYGGLQRFDTNTNTWTDLAAPHQEERSYQWAGVNSPEYQQAFLDRISGTADAYDLARLSTPGAIGQAITRSDLSDFSPLGGTQLDRENTFYHQLDTPGIELTPEQLRIAEAQIASSTPEAQDARDVDTFLEDIAPMIAIVGAGFGLPALIESFAGMAGAGVASGPGLFSESLAALSNPAVYGDVLATGALGDVGALSLAGDAYLPGTLATGSNVGLEGLGALNSFDTGAMANALGYTKPTLGDTLLANLQSQFTPSKIGSRLLTNVGSNLLQGRDTTLEGLLKGQLVGGLSGTVGGTVSNYLPTTNPNFVNSFLSGAAAGGTGSALTGGDILQGAFSGGAGAGINSLFTDYVNPTVKGYLTELGLSEDFTNDFTNFASGQLSSYLNSQLQQELFGSSGGTNQGTSGQIGATLNQPDYSFLSGTSIPDFISGLQVSPDWSNFMNFSQGSKKEVDPYFIEQEGYNPSGEPKAVRRVNDNQASPGTTTDFNQQDTPYIVG